MLGEFGLECLGETLLFHAFPQTSLPDSMLFGAAARKRVHTGSFKACLIGDLRVLD